MSDLERALHRLRQDLDWPDDDIASRVEARLPAALPTGRGHRRRRTVLVAAVLAPVLAAGLTVTPMRDRVADAFSLIGITFRQTSSGGLGLPGDLALGEPISLAVPRPRCLWPAWVVPPMASTSTSRYPAAW